MRFTVRGGNAPLLKRQNRAAVLRAIVGFGPISRRALRDRTGLTASTITNIVAELIGAGQVQELGEIEPVAGASRAGRREVLIDLTADSGIVVGAYIGVNETNISVGGPRAEILHRLNLPTLSERGPADLIRRLVDGVEALLDQTGTDRGRLIGFGLGAVGIVDPEGGVLRDAPELGWRDVPLRAMLQEAVDLPIVLDSGRRGMALAEMMFGLGQHVRDFAHVHIASTIVAGLVLDQRLHRGATGTAGSLGHTTVAGERQPCGCGKIGCLDTIASEVAMERRAAEVAAVRPDGLLARELAARTEPVGRFALYRAARAGDADALAIIVEAGRYLGRAIANVLSVIDVRLVVLSGDVARDFPPFVDAVRAAIEVHTFRVDEVTVEVVASPFGGDMRVKGSLALALYDLLYAPTLTLQPAVEETAS
ncbi:MAG: ROK family transcriptional regulator [Chloroflexi bacterium]|nr:ROK family transcriptional regulator [Chloroflexota bacterium]